VINGVEINVEYNLLGNNYLTNMEMLGLNFDVSAIIPFIDLRRYQRIRSIELTIDAYNRYISSLDFNQVNKKNRFPLKKREIITLTEILRWKKEVKQHNNSFVNKNDLLMYMVENIAEENEIIDQVKKYHKQSGELFRTSYQFIFSTRTIKPSFYEAIKKIKEAKGKAVFAHPGTSKTYYGILEKEWMLPKENWYKNADSLTPFNMIKDLKNKGLDGLEIYNYLRKDPNHSQDADRINEYFSGIADRLSLLKTYGSDCHGPIGNGPQIGRFGSKRIIELD
jgi:hypothetical protein